MQEIREVEKHQEEKEETCAKEQVAKVLPMEQEKKRKKKLGVVRKRKQKLVKTN